MPDREEIPGRSETSERPFLLSLSPRESQVLRLAASGLTADLMARRLKLSERTVREYLSSARQKMRADNTTHAVAVAIQHGLISIQCPALPPPS